MSWYWGRDDPFTHGVFARQFEYFTDPGGESDAVFASGAEHAIGSDPG